MSSGPKNKAIQKLAWGALPQAGSLLHLFFDPEDGGSIFLRNDFHRATQRYIHVLRTQSCQRKSATQSTQKFACERHNLQNIAYSLSTSFQPIKLSNEKPLIDFYFLTFCPSVLPLSHFIGFETVIGETSSKGKYLYIQVLYRHCFSPLLLNMPLGKSRKTRWDFN
jgi:hypothetical protein